MYREGAKDVFMQHTHHRRERESKRERMKRGDRDHDRVKRGERGREKDNGIYILY